MDTSILVAMAVGFILISVLIALFFKQLKGVFLLVLNTLLGWVGLYIFNLAFAGMGLFIGINIASATVLGVLGVPGLLLLLVLKFIYK